ncbi:hypothetical protein JI739_11395 [Ramlibacter sp. AW1]|uniref:Uncharacterized protein n=1 Tax=Ramlibacter aurantiacus TaxID=2801330 RepID=A0A937D541_9BURK|nr:hypothetical protein [Ramlibacter aurantiacus]MBL0420952.1 hypothetical protein [Ramlibacter aurantiacus]
MSNIHSRGNGHLPLEAAHAMARHRADGLKGRPSHKDENVSNSGQLMADSDVQEINRSGNPESPDSMAWLTRPSMSATELGLPAIRSEPLHLRTVQDERVLDRTGVFEGVNFATLIRFSAVLSGPGFKEALQAVHREPGSVSAAEREALDAHLRQCVEHETSRDGAPVSHQRAIELLIKGLTALTN